MWWYDRVRHTTGVLNLRFPSRNSHAAPSNAAWTLPLKVRFRRPLVVEKLLYSSTLQTKYQPIPNFNLRAFCSAAIVKSETVFFTKGSAKSTALLLTPHFLRWFGVALVHVQDSRVYSYWISRLVHVGWVYVENGESCNPNLLYIYFKGGVQVLIYGNNRCRVRVARLFQFISGCSS